MRGQRPNSFQIFHPSVIYGWPAMEQRAGVLIHRAFRCTVTFQSLLPVLCLLLLIPGGSSAGIEERQFDKILHLVQMLYAPDFVHRQQRLRINGYWESEQALASARIHEDRDGQLAVIAVTGGLARHPAITDGALALIVCHEIGHFLAGPPAVRGYSTEGQSDYYAAAACMKRLMLRMLSEDLMDRHFVSPIMRKRCESAYDSEPASAVCSQTIMAGYALSRYFAYQQSINAPQFETPDPGKAEAIGFGMPTVQCRLDTYIAGALCNPQGAEDASHPDRPWLCSRHGALAEFARPACWYPRGR